MAGPKKGFPPPPSPTFNLPLPLLMIPALAKLISGCVVSKGVPVRGGKGFKWVRSTHHVTTKFRLGDIASGADEGGGRGVDHEFYLSLV